MENTCATTERLETLKIDNLHVCQQQLSLCNVMAVILRKYLVGLMKAKVSLYLFFLTVYFPIGGDKTTSQCGHGMSEA